jgi:hypothetical protein
MTVCQAWLCFLYVKINRLNEPPGALLVIEGPEHWCGQKHDQHANQALHVRYELALLAHPGVAPLLPLQLLAPRIGGTKVGLKIVVQQMGVGMHTGPLVLYGFLKVP